MVFNETKVGDHLQNGFAPERWETNLRRQQVLPHLSFIKRRTTLFPYGLSPDFHWDREI